MDLHSANQTIKIVNYFQTLFLSELVLHYNLKGVILCNSRILVAHLRDKGIDFEVPLLESVRFN